LKAYPPSVVAGTTLSPAQYVQVRWAWLGFLAIELFLSAVFLVGIMFATRVAGMQVLKDSSLATMCALDSATRCHLGS
ncbi:hypothetical protein GQ53DRAFT_598345, partial [Thozetella sp. PMI_491]